VKGSNESEAHYLLKRAALLWLYDRGVRTIAFEVPVRTPGFARMILDVAAHDHRTLVERYRGPRGGWHRRRLASVDELIAIECKATRADFLRDGGRIDRLLRTLESLDRRREVLEEEIRRREPHLAARDHLFTADVVWRYERSAHPEYVRLRRRIASVTRRLHRGTKFESLRAEGLFHRHYLCTPAGLVRPVELPEGWGLLELRGSEGMPRIAREATPTAGIEQGDRDVIRRIARAGTRALIRAVGLCVGEAGLEPAPDGNGPPMTPRDR
jgi:hypothetical protein